MAPSWMVIDSSLSNWNKTTMHIWSINLLRCKKFITSQAYIGNARTPPPPYLPQTLLLFLKCTKSLLCFQIWGSLTHQKELLHQPGTWLQLTLFIWDDNKWGSPVVTLVVTLPLWKIHLFFKLPLYHHNFDPSMQKVILSFTQITNQINPKLDRLSQLYPGTYQNS